MKSSTNVLLTAVYPGVENYIQVFANSVNKQSNQNFDLVIVNDGCSINLNSLFKKDIIELKSKNETTPGAVRKLGINYVCELGYEKLVFADADDFISMDRVEESLNGLAKADFVYNNLIPVNVAGEELITQRKISFPKVVSNFNDLLRFNFIGLGNSAVNVEVIKEIYLPEDLVAFDWYLYCCILLNKNRGAFVENAISYYRQYDENTVGWNKKFSEDSLNLGIKVKLQHYDQLLLCLSEGSQLSLIEIVKKEKEEIYLLKEKLKDEQFSKEFLNKINARRDNEYKGWWSEIANEN